MKITNYSGMCLGQTPGAVSAVVLLMALAAVAGQTGALPPVLVRGPHMYLDYDVAGMSTEDVACVELWCAKGADGPWRLYGYDEDKLAPAKFVAEGEGLYRFLVVVQDRWGRRSCGNDVSGDAGGGRVPPDVQAQASAVVDYTPPQLVLMSEKSIATEDGRQLLLRWAGFDTNLDSRPVHLYYQHGGAEQWTPIAEAQAAVGEFTWTVPETVMGDLLVRAVLQDQAGNRDVQSTGPLGVRLVGWQEGAAEPLPGEALPAVTVAVGPDSEVRPNIEPATAALWVKPNVPAGARGSDRKQVAQSCFGRGILHQKRKEWPQAARAFEQALDYDPDWAEARVNLANSLFSCGQLEGAQKHYEISLQVDPMRTAALYGLGYSYLGTSDYERAERAFERLVRCSPRDWQGWLGHGDAAAKLGKMDVARASWVRASRGDLEHVAKMAYERLANNEP